MGRLSGRVTLVTGASRGIGRAVAKRFAAEGAEVICVARTQGGLEELDDEITAAAAASGNTSGYGKAVLCPLNLREFDKIDQVAAAMFERFGKLDVLAGIAGDIGGGLAPIGHIDQKHFQEAFDVNVTANYRLIRAFDPLLRISDAGRALFVTSGTQGTYPYWGVYAATKAALETIVTTWAAEVANISKLRVNLIDPGVVATRMRAIAFPGEDPTTLPQPEDITEAFVALAEAGCTRHGEKVFIR